MRFVDREHAAHMLAQALARYRGASPLVLAIPRGAVPMGRVLADELGGELDAVLVRKLGAPGNPEIAIGSIDEHGRIYQDPAATGLASPEHLETEAALQLGILRRRRRQYTPIRPPVDPRGRIAIVVDDGLATGSTMIAALRAVRAQGPARLIAAAAVAPEHTLDEVAREADEMACLYAPSHFLSVGQFFEDFRQVTDEEVIAVLRQAADPVTAASRAPAPGPTRGASWGK